MPSAPERSLEVLPPSRRGETAAVLRAAAVVLVVALLWIGSTRARFDGAGRDRWSALLPFQTRFTDLPAPLQRALREMHEGALEALRLRGDEGKWPDAGRLASELVPPFADDGVDRGCWRWSSRAASYAFQYLGVPARDDGTRALLMLFLEPRPTDTEGRDPRAVLPLDEQHRRLPDGTLLHVSFWVESAGVKPSDDAFVQDPALEGWTQVLSGTAAAAPAGAGMEGSR